MKKYIIHFLIIGGIFSIINVSGQNMSLPKWILGGWHNSYESNTDRFVFWTFIHDSIFINKGLIDFKNPKVESLNKMYNGYNIKPKSNDSVYRIEFSKPQNITIYEFKLQKVSYSIDPVLTYSLWVNGINKRKQSTSLNAVFTKQ